MKDDMMQVVLEAIITGDPSAAIENQEKRGQSELVNSVFLPVQCPQKDRAALEEMGVVFGEQVDDLFVNATLPAGWSKQATDHSMWSKLVDENGEEVASIFYKAAFYDRDAFMNLTRRKEQ